MENIITKSNCPHHELCGGCQYQGIEYGKQCEIKQNEILALLDEYQISRDVYDGFRKANTQFSYRNKMEYTFGDLTKGGELELGMHQKGKFMSVVTTDHCEIVSEDFNKILARTKQFCLEKKYPLYNKKTHEGILRNLIIRAGINTGELLIDIVLASNHKFDNDAFVEALLELPLDFKIVGILRTKNDSLADAVVDEGTEVLYGRDFYNEKILGLNFRVQVFAFFQTNIPAIEILYSDAIELISDIDDKIVYDLYSGTGTISQLMASRAKEVYGIEISKDAVNSAVKNTELNKISNCHYIVGDVKDELDNISVPPDVLVVDPPRIGLHNSVIHKLASYGVPEILYISCNPKTLCHNLAEFRRLGYSVNILKAYDNFPLTRHVECVVLLSKHS